MRASAFCWAISLALAGCVATEPPAPRIDGGAAPTRVVSLNLCTDELLLELADPAQIASVTHLSHRPEETGLWQAARRHAANDGSVASVASLRPDLVLTVGGGGDRLRIAERLGIAAVDLPYPQSLADIVAAVRTVARALGREARGEAVVARIVRLQASAPAAARDTMWIGGGGRTVAADGLEAQWMALAGLRQRAVTGNRVSLETLLVTPPAVMLRSDYRAGQFSREQAWLAHPLARAARGSRMVATDGRPWTCLGPEMIAEVERLRA